MPCLYNPFLQNSFIEFFRTPHHGHQCGVIFAISFRSNGIDELKGIAVVEIARAQQNEERGDSVGRKSTYPVLP